MVYIICTVQQYNVWDILGKNLYFGVIWWDTCFASVYMMILHLWSITLPIPDQISAWLKMRKVLIDLRDYNFQRHGAIILQ